MNEAFPSILRPSPRFSTKPCRAAVPVFGTTAVVTANDANGDGFADIFVGPLFGVPFFSVFSGRDQSYLGLGLPGGTFVR